MKKKYISPETEMITAWAKCNTEVWASYANYPDGTSQRIDSYDEDDNWTFVVGAKQHIWDDEDSPWNDYMN